VKVEKKLEKKIEKHEEIKIEPVKVPASPK
jgi:hypothetical protein